MLQLIVDQQINQLKDSLLENTKYVNFEEFKTIIFYKVEVAHSVN